MKLLTHFKELTVHPKNAEELKGLILQLAIQGKLTAQWRKDNPDLEPASNLLKKISAEKTLLVKEKKIKKEKSIPNIENDEPLFVLPESWIWCRLGDIIKISSGNGLTSNQMDKSGNIPVYGGNGIAGYHSLGNINEETIVIGRVGYYCGCIHLTEKIAWVTDNAFITKYSKSNIDRDFLVWLLKGTNLKEDENATAQPVISGRKVYPLKIALPPLEEQKAIVSIVNQLFKEVEKLERETKVRIQLKEDFVTSALNQLANGDTATEWAYLQPHFHTFFTEKSSIKKLRESILQLAVQGKLTRAFRETHPELCEGSNSASALIERIKAEKAQLIKAGKIKKEKPLPEISEDEIPFELPEGWVWCRLEDLTSITGGVTKGKKNQTDLVNVPYLRVANVQRGFLNLDLLKDILVSKPDYKKYQLLENDLLMIEGGDPDKVGRCAIWSSEIPGCIYQNHVFRVRPYLDSTMDNHFFMQFINSRVTRDYYESCAKRTTNLASINKTQMRSTPMAFPPLEEQKAIVEKVNALMGFCENLEKEIEQNAKQLEDLMQSSLREVFEGKEEEKQEVFGMAAKPKEE